MDGHIPPEYPQERNESLATPSVMESNMKNATSQELDLSTVFESPVIEDHDDSLERQSKISLVLEACKTSEIGALCDLATACLGFVDDATRQQAWPVLLGVSQEEMMSVSSDDDVDQFKQLPPHRDEHQVQLDVERAFIYYPNGTEITPKELDRRKAQLATLINGTLRQNPFLCYFQGYHDISQVLLLVLGPRLARPALSRLSLLRVRDFMLPNLHPALSHLSLLPPLLLAAEPRLHSHLSQIQPFFALAATLTLYAHDIQDYGDIARLFDVLLAREPVFSVYLFAQTVILRGPELLEMPPEEPEMLYAVLCKMPQPLALETLIKDAVLLFESHPPESLTAWHRISSYSVLKTARSPGEAACQTVEEGARLFRLHAAQLRRREMFQAAVTRLWSHRRSAGTVGLAVVVGLLSWWMRKQGVVQGSASIGQVILGWVSRQCHFPWSASAATKL